MKFTLHYKTPKNSIKPDYWYDFDFETAKGLPWYYLRELLHYDPYTGKFTWIKEVHNKGVDDYAGTTKHSSGYRVITIEGFSYQAHVLAWFYMTGKWPVCLIDHIDGCPINNKWLNLRQATTSQNSFNKKKLLNNKSGYKGVFLLKGYKYPTYEAKIQANGICYRLGKFPTSELAYAAYCDAAKIYHGQFARLA